MILSVKTSMPNPQIKSFVFSSVLNEGFPLHHIGLIGPVLLG